MDMGKYSTSVIMPEDLHNGARVEKIARIFEHEKHGCAVLEFESADQLFLWPNLAKVLRLAWGRNGDNWLGQEVELTLGHFFDKKNTGMEKECIEIRAVSPAKTAGNG